MRYPLWLLLAPLSLAQDSSDSVATYDESDKYTYYGCYNETTGLADTDGSRALADGINETKQSAMTVPLCLEFCGDGDTEYRYAGLEWSRECWCAQTLSGLAAKLDDGECNFPCAGNDTMACGAALKLSVYELSDATRALGFPALLLSSTLALTLLSLR